MSKIKTTSKGNVKLTISVDQLTMISKLVTLMQLGDHNKFSEAASELLHMLEQEFGTDWLDDLDKSLSVTIKDVVTHQIIADNHYAMMATIEYKGVSYTQAKGGCNGCNCDGCNCE